MLTFWRIKNGFSSDCITLAGRTEHWCDIRREHLLQCCIGTMLKTNLLRRLKRPNDKESSVTSSRPSLQQSSFFFESSHSFWDVDNEDSWCTTVLYLYEPKDSSSWVCNWIIFVCITNGKSSLVSKGPSLLCSCQLYPLSSGARASSVLLMLGSRTTFRRFVTNRQASLFPGC